MYKSKEERNKYHRDYMKRKRQGLTDTEGLTSPTTSGAGKGLTSGGLGLTSVREIAEKLVDPAWRTRIERISTSLGPLSSEVRLNGVTMSTWGKLLGITSI